MDETFYIILAVGLVVIVPVATMILMIVAIRQGRRLRGLETRLGQLEQGARSEAPEGAPAIAESPTTATEQDRESETPLQSVATDAGPWRRQQGQEPVLDEGIKPDTAETEPDRELDEKPAYAPPRAFVLRADKARALGVWLAANWIYVVAAVSLSLAGIFLLQYGIEKGLLPPAMRVAIAILFGAALVASGEYLRRRWGDDAEATTAYLPSVFSGAGIVTLFAAVLAALHLYALIGPALALSGLVAVAILAIVLGWFSGPLLAAMGIVGAMVAPFIVGGDSDRPELFYLYFVLITLVGMVIDAVRRWAWVTLLALALGNGAGFILYAESGGPEWFAGFVAVMAIAAVAIPPLRLWPTHSGAAMFEMFRSGLPSGWPEFPTRVAWGTWIFSVAALTLLSLEDTGMFWLSTGILSVLFAAMAIWARKAQALEDLAALPVLGLLGLLFLQDYADGGVLAQFTGFMTAEPGTTMPLTMFMLAGIGAGLSIIAAWRSLTIARWPVGWAACAALTGPLVMVVLEIWWQPAQVIGPYPWALTAAAMAVVMGALAGSFARVDGDEKSRAALFVLAALSMISFALIQVLSEAALTLALALTMLAAAAIDLRFNMAPLAWFVQVGVVVVGWRLIIDPGVDWAASAGIGHVVAVYAGSIAALVSALSVLRGMARLIALTMLESAAWTLLAVFASVMLFRLIDRFAGTGGQFETHWGIGLLALVWLASAANQTWRMQAGGKIITWVRAVLAVLFATVGSLSMIVAFGPLNPLLSKQEIILGWPVLNTLIPAYLLPSLVVAFVVWRFEFLPRHLRIILGAVASAGVVFWLALAIRHFWQGEVIAGPGTLQGELYSYTIAMLLIGGGLLYHAISRGSVALRRVAMSVIALTVAKVFLVDISGLTGLTRVFSFLALGLSLAGLAWLNRWAAGQGSQRDGEAQGD